MTWVSNFGNTNLDKELKEILIKHNAEFCKCGHEIGWGDIAWNQAVTEYGTEHGYVEIQCLACQEEITEFHTWYPFIEDQEDVIHVLKNDWGLRVEK